MVKIKESKTPKTPKLNKNLSAIGGKSTPFKHKNIAKAETPKLRKAAELTGVKIGRTPKVDVAVTPKKTPKSLELSSKSTPFKNKNTPKLENTGVKIGRTPKVNAAVTPKKTPKTLELSSKSTPFRNKKIAKAETPKLAKAVELSGNKTPKVDGAKTPKKNKKSLDLSGIKKFKSPKQDVTATPNVGTPSNGVIKRQKKTPKVALAETPKVRLSKTPKLKKTIDDLSLNKNGTTAKKSKGAKKTLKTTKKSVVEAEKTDNSELEEKYNVKSADVETAVTGVLKFASENPKLKNQLFSEKRPLFLQMSCFKIPKGHSQILRIPLKNSLLTPDDDICFIVSDVKGFKNKEHDKHLEHYEELFDKKGIKNIKKVMTFHEFRTEYETFELRNRLVDLYDYFLVEGKISGKVVNKCGKIFYKKRKVPNPIKLKASKLKEHIEKSLLKTQCNLTGHGDSYTIQFGHSKMEISELVENVFSLIEGLEKNFPGGFNNIRNLHISTQQATSIPIYISLKNPNDVAVPKIKPVKVKGPKFFKGELTTVTDADVVVSRDGNVKVLKKNIEKSNPDEFSIDDLVKIINKNDEATGKKKKRKRANNTDEMMVEEEGSEVNKKSKKPKKNKVQNGKIEKKKLKKGKIAKHSPMNVVPKKKKIQKIKP